MFCYYRASKLADVIAHVNAVSWKVDRWAAEEADVRWGKWKEDGDACGSCCRSLDREGRGAAAGCVYWGYLIKWIWAIDLDGRGGALLDGVLAAVRCRRAHHRCSPPSIEEEGMSWICNHDVVAVLSNGSDHLIGASPVVGCAGRFMRKMGLGIFDLCNRMVGSGSMRRPRHFGWLRSAVCTTAGELAVGSHGRRP
ncbi:hypothetical protein ACLOJK_037352 [Asimina triloba]